MTTDIRVRNAAVTPDPEDAPTRAALGDATVSRTDNARAAAEDSLEDYAFRYVPRTFRRWSAAAVGATALGSIAFLADFSIGASIGIDHGTGNAVLGILFASVIIVIVGGLGSLTGALLGGVLIGLSEALAALVISPVATRGVRETRTVPGPPTTCA